MHNLRHVQLTFLHSSIYFSISSLSWNGDLFLDSFLVAILSVSTPVLIDFDGIIQSRRQYRLH